MNSICLIGRITNELKIQEAINTQTKYVRFNLAVNEYSGGRENTNFIPCTVFGVQAENLVKFMRKGSQIGVSGSLNVRSIRLENGEYKTSFGVSVSRVEFLGKPSSSQNSHDFDADDIPFETINSQQQSTNSNVSQEEQKQDDSSGYLDDSILWD